MNTKTITLRFADAVARRRREAGITQEALAANAGVHRTYVGDIENARKSPTLEVSDAIARALGVRLSDIIAEAER